MNAPVLVVGGDEEFIWNVFRTKVAPHGIQVGWIWDRHTTPSYTLPSGCGGVIIIKSAIGHSMDNQAAAMARDAGVPFVRVEHRFSRALPILRAVGMAEPENNGVGRPEPSSEQKYELILSYLQQELEKGRTPSRGELRGVIKRAFGPHVGLNDKIVKRARSIAAAEHAAHGDPMPAEPAYDLNQLSEWAILIIEERPEDGLDKWVSRLRDLTVGDLPPEPELRRFVQQVFDEERALWEQHHKTWSPEKGQSIMAMRRGWTERFLREHRTEDGAFPWYSTIQEESVKLFGKAIHGGMIREMKDKILADAEEALPPEPEAPEPTPPAPQPPAPEQPEATMPNTKKMSPARVEDAIKFARSWHKDLTPPQAAMLHDWVHRIMRNPSKARTSTDVKDLFVTFRRKPVEFCAAFLLLVPKGQCVTRGMIGAAYKKVMKVGLDPTIINPLAERLRLTNRLTTHRVDPEEGEPVDGFFPSLNDAYNYYLKHAVEHISMKRFRQLLNEGEIEAAKQGQGGRFSPWLVSHAALDEYMRTHGLGEPVGTPAPEEPAEEETPEGPSEVEALQARIAELEQSVRDSDKLAETYSADAEEWKRKAEAWKVEASETQAKLSSAQQEVEEQKNKVSSLSGRYASEKQRADKQQTRADDLQAAMTGHRGREHALNTEIERLKGEVETLGQTGASKRIETLTQSLETANRTIEEWEVEGRRLEGEKLDLQSRLDDTLGKLREATDDLAAAENRIATLELAAEVAPAPSGSMTVDELIREAMNNGYSFVLKPIASE